MINPSSIMIKAIGGKRGGIPVRNAEVKGDTNPTQTATGKAIKKPATMIGKNIGKKALPKPML